jgi:hypothetical protein
MHRSTTHAPEATSGCTNVGNEHVARGGDERPPGSRRSAQQAALYCHICSTLDNCIRNQNQAKEQSLHVNFPLRLQQYHKVGYEDAKTWMERRLAEMKSGVPNWVATALAGEWAGNLGNNITDLDRGIAKIEAANLAKHYEWWHVPRLGHMENLRPDGVFCIWRGQLNSTSSLDVCAQKIADVV